MAGINDYSNTAGSNTTINGIDISEGCSPAGINNAIRQLMADIADMDDGVVPLQTPDINGGTIDGASLGASSPITSAVISGDLTVDTNTLYVDSTNNLVGIGTSSPSDSVGFQSAIDISSSVGGAVYFRDSDSPSTAMYVGYIGSNSTSYLWNQANGPILFGTNDTEAMRINSSGNVGIGTSSPTTTLDVNGTITGTFIQSSGNIFATSGIFRSSDGSAAVPSIQPGVDNDTGFFRPASNTIGFSTAGTEQMRLSSSGYLGINTTSPSAHLEVVGTIQVTNTVNASNNSNIRDSGGIVIEAGNNNPIYFYTDGSEQMRIDNNAVGIGVAASTANMLRVRGEGATSATVAFRAEDSGGNILFLARNDGRLFTGTSSSSPYNLTTGSAANMYVSSGGVLYRSTSSLKYKTEIQDANYGLNDVMNLRSVTYKSINDGEKIFGGLIAEEVHEAGLTEFVQYDDEGNPDALHYGNMVSLCIKAIQELKADNDALKARIETLENA